MTLSAWRIVQERHAQNAFSGEGARLFGGRWNSAGTAMVYTAASRALAALEILVHLEAPQLLRGFVVFEVTFEESLIQDLRPEDLPADWREDPVPQSTQALGDHWIAEASSPVLRVPSVIIPQETNFLLNPNHSAFGQIHIGSAEGFTFDSRLQHR